ncbi:MAG: UDP-N-acetylmuramoyl-L-alanine--D-glutamate ligase [Bacteroidales bacterium]|nr:UDP-N-acetylmuramoyl-L-alanine--D-glutamate ligase [Bacteroidales bacterium]
MDRLVILGGGESGVGAALLGQKKRYDVFLSDSGALKPQHKAELDAAGISYEEGGHTEANILNANLIIKSPGIPEKAPIIKALRAKGTKIISEIEFGGWYTKARKICITGSNGKTTTTLLTHHLLSSSGVRAELAGNVGTSLARQIAAGNEPDWYVIELSSFQLDGMYDFKADIAILNNITPDHLDRYEYKFENYIRSKFRILQNQTKADAFICNVDDPTTAEWLPKVTIGATRYDVSTHHEANAFAADGKITVKAKGSLTFDANILPIKGLHNIYNSMQACAAAQLAGVADADILKALPTFKNAAHRLEFVRTFEGVDYVNDSKATNVDSAWYALECQQKPVVWIAGGTDKGNDYSTLNDLVRAKVHALVCLGVDNAKLIKSYTGIIPVIEEARSMDECVAKCRALAKKGDVVLLSPCCASFDLFNSYIHRGNLFKESVNNLK